MKLVDLPGQDCLLLLQEFSKYCSNLQEIDIFGAYFDLLGDSIAALVRSSQQLHTLRLVNGSNSERSVDDILLSCNHLTTLRLYMWECNLTASVGRPTLVHLDMRGCRISDEVLVAIGKHCPKLETLRCFARYQTRAAGFTDVGMLAVLNGCPLLRTADAKYACTLSTEVRVQMATRWTYSRLHLHEWPGMSSDLASRLLGVCPDLVELSAHCNVLCDDALVALAQHCPPLQTLAIAVCWNITTAGAAVLFKVCSGLRVVTISNCYGLGDATSSIAQHCPRLETCTLLGQPVTDKGIGSLARGCPELTVLQVDSAFVTDRGMAALADHRRLSRLLVRGSYNVTIEGIRAVVNGCAALTQLSVPQYLRAEAAVVFPASASGVKVL